MREDICVVLSNDNKGVTIKQTLDSIVKAGFKNVFVQFYDEKWDIDQIEQIKLAKDRGLNIIFAHLGYQNINEIWKDSIDGEAFVDRYINDIKVLKSLGVDMVVMHASSKFDGPRVSEIGLNRFARINEFAKSIGVKIAIENTRMLAHLQYVLRNINDDNLGLCFDFGHYHCNNKDNFDIAEFKDRVFAVHLHDNDGSSDQHLLPFDGSNNWPKLIKMLDEVNYDGPITLEVCYKKDYMNNSLDEYYHQAYKRALAIKELL